MPFNSTGPHRCPVCPPIVCRPKGRPPFEQSVALQLNTRNYSGTGVDIAVCPECRRHFQISYVAATLTRVRRWEFPDLAADGLPDEYSLLRPVTPPGPGLDRLAARKLKALITKLVKQTLDFDSLKLTGRPTESGERLLKKAKKELTDWIDGMTRPDIIGIQTHTQPAK